MKKEYITPEMSESLLYTEADILTTSYEISDDTADSGEQLGKEDPDIWGE